MSPSVTSATIDRERRTLTSEGDDPSDPTLTPVKELSDFTFRGDFDAGSAGKSAEVPEDSKTDYEVTSTPTPTPAPEAHEAYEDHGVDEVDEVCAMNRSAPASVPEHVPTLVPAPAPEVCEVYEDEPTQGEIALMEEVPYHSVITSLMYIYGAHCAMTRYRLCHHPHSHVRQQPRIAHWLALKSMSATSREPTTMEYVLFEEEQNSTVRGGAEFNPQHWPNCCTAVLHLEENPAHCGEEYREHNCHDDTCAKWCTTLVCQSAFTGEDEEMIQVATFHG